MDLILWRHAEAEDGFPDLARELTAKGRKQAKQMAAWLNARLPADTRILVSPAARTQQTATALERDFSTRPELSPGAGARQLLEAAGWPDADGTVLIVGHQPTLGEAAALAMSGRLGSWGVKKGAILWLSRRAVSDGCALRAALSPDLI